jgi:uracil-DNA glycosylase family 4
MIQVDGNVIVVTPIVPKQEDINQQSINNCIKIARMNAINKKLYNNCFDCGCPIADKTLSKVISNGSYNASTMFVDAFPSEYETYTGTFTDEKGYFIEQVLSELNIDRQSIYFTNMIKCSNVKDSNPNIISKCLNNYFITELDLINPKKLVVDSSTLNALQKYGVITCTGEIKNFFSEYKIKTINGMDMNIYVIPKVINVMNADLNTKRNFKEGLKMILS